MTTDTGFNIGADYNPEDKYGRFFRDYDIDIELIENFAFAGQGGSVDLTNYYTKTEADALLLTKENVTDLSGSFYTKTQVNSFLANKADATALNSYLLTTTRGAAAGVASLDNSTLVPFAQLPTGIGASQVAVGNHTHSIYAPKNITRRAYITTGSITPPDTSGAWQAISGFEIDLPAVAGDEVEIAYNAMSQSSNATHYDIAVKTAGSGIVRYLATGTATPATEGDPGWYPNAISTFLPHPSPKGFTVASSDIDGGNVRFVLVTKSNATGLLYAEAAYPFYWQARNYGPSS